MIADYVTHRNATPGAKHKVLLELSTAAPTPRLYRMLARTDLSGCFALGCSPLGEIFAARDGGVHVFNENGHFDRLAPVFYNQENRAGLGGFAFDAAHGELIFSHRDKGSVIVMDRVFNRREVRWSDTRSGGPKWPVGVAFADDRVYVCDHYWNQVRVYHRHGRFLFAIGQPSHEAKDGHFSYPFGIAISAKGDVFVSDQDHCHIQVFDKSGKLLRRFGTQGRAPGQFSFPQGLAFDSADQLIVADHGNNRLQIFKQDGTLVTVCADAEGEARFTRVHCVCLDSIGRICVGSDSAVVTVIGF